MVLASRAYCRDAPLTLFPTKKHVVPAGLVEWAAEVGVKTDRALLAAPVTDIAGPVAGVVVAQVEDGAVSVGEPDCREAGVPGAAVKRAVQALSAGLPVPATFHVLVVK